MKALIITMVAAALVKLAPTGDLPYEPKYKDKVNEAYSFVKQNKMDTTVCFLVDMREHMGKKRFAIWDFKGDSVQREMVVMHGSAGTQGREFSWPDKPVFSNVPGSNASSLGRYRVGKRSYSNWGINIHYKLHGLDSTNNNAYRRIVVLHSYWGVDQSELYPESGPYSLGCPMVSNEDMTYLDSLLKKKKDVMMWMYY